MKDVNDSPSLFPFRLKPIHVQSLLAASASIDILRHGLDADLVTLRKQPTKGGHTTIPVQRACLNLYVDPVLRPRCQSWCELGRVRAGSSSVFAIFSEVMGPRKFEPK